jgi:RNA polymerase sigma-70 factor, ECF subfamily
MSNRTTLDKVHAVKEFHNLIILHLPLLRQKALSFTRHKADAEDLVQAAVTSAIAAQNSFSVGTNFKAWIMCILRNRFLSNVRQRRFLVDLGEVPEGLLGRSGGQEDNLEITELKRQMLRLPPDQLLILLMVSIEGVSYDDASEQLGVAVGTLKCRVFRARAQLEVWMHGREQSAKSSKLPAIRRTASIQAYARRSAPEVSQSIGP